MTAAAQEVTLLEAPPPPQLVAQILHELSKGRTMAALADSFRVSFRTVQRLANRHGYPDRDRLSRAAADMLLTAPQGTTAPDVADPASADEAAGCDVDQLLERARLHGFGADADLVDQLLRTLHTRVAVADDLDDARARLSAAQAEVDRLAAELASLTEGMR